jgi:hypothetical protein
VGEAGDFTGAGHRDVLLGWRFVDEVLLPYFSGKVT